MTLRAPANRRGSLLIVTLVSVAVVVMLSLGASLLMRAQSARQQAAIRHRMLRVATGNAATLAMADRLAADTNGWDTLLESWSREPWERRDQGWILRVSAEGWSTIPGATRGLEDEARRINLNSASPALLGALATLVAGLDAGSAARLAETIVDWRDADALAADGAPESVRYARDNVPAQPPDRPFAAVAELAGVPGLTPELLARLIPFLTVYGDGRVNLNTAAPPVLRAVLESVAAGDRGAVQALLDRLLAHRLAGFAFAAATPTVIGRDLQGLSADQSALLARAEPLLSAASDCFGGVAEAVSAADYAARIPGARARFVWQRSTAQFLLWIDE